LDIVWNLACLREAASAKAGAWSLVLYRPLSAIFVPSISKG
jgi:hypothetical protein